MKKAKRNDIDREKLKLMKTRVLVDKVGIAHILLHGGRCGSPVVVGLLLLLRRSI